VRGLSEDKKITERKIDSSTHIQVVSSGHIIHTS
jgi:hypothetical protein